MIVGCALQAGSINYAMILVSRVISGFGNGMLTSTIPAYQSECAKPSRRGQLVLFEGSLITFVSGKSTLHQPKDAPVRCAYSQIINISSAVVTRSRKGTY
jgi:hypothetical protein